jgi:hypothetical protein
MSEQLKFCYSDKSSVPPGGWTVKCPITGEVIEGGDFGDMVRNCERKILEQGLIPPTDIIQQIENALCERLAGYRQCVPCSSVKQTLGFGEIVRWVRAMYFFATKSHFQLVDQEEAERRAKICAACPHQISTSGCWGCKGIAGMLPAISGARKTSYDAQLKACGVCGCYNAVSVHLPLSVQQDASLDFPSHCWKKSQSE